MSKTRLFVDVRLMDQGTTLHLFGNQAHYLVRVMRRCLGDVVELFDGQSDSRMAEIQEIGKTHVSLVIGPVAHSFMMPPPLTLAFAPIKKERTDFVIEKATELGVRTIQPIITAYTNTARVNLERLQRHAIEAAEQCGGTYVPKLCPPVHLHAYLAEARGVLLFCDEMRHECTPWAELPRNAGPTIIFIGPEGGFSPEERQMLRDRSARAVSLGPRILRAETAAVAALALWQAHYGDWHFFDPD